MKKIEIYTTNYCPFCVKAKSLLNKKKIKVYEIDVSNDEALREKMSAMANGARSVPQIFVDNIHDLRTSIRRMTTIYKILSKYPKKKRK